jgi:hypothetical protein
MARSEMTWCWPDSGQQGFSLIGFLSTLILLGMAGLLALRAGPSVLEYWAIKKAVSAAAAVSDTPAELRDSYDKMASVGFADALQGKDLKVSGRGKDLQASFAYQKKIPLFGSTSLLIEYQGSTAEEGQERAAK